MFLGALSVFVKGAPLLPQPFMVERFDGLNLIRDPTEIGATGAVDLLNVDFGRDGRIRQRPGAQKFNTTTPSSTGYVALLPADRFGVLGGVRRDALQDIVLDSFSTAGVVSTGSPPVADSGTWEVGSSTTFSGVLLFTVWEAATGHALMTDGTGGGLAVVGGAGKPGLVATWAAQSRIAQGYYAAAADAPSGANGSVSTVFFSDAGGIAPWTSTNWVKLRPGDGESIVAIVSWRELLFVFKQSGLAVFYGISTDSSGNPVFNYRWVDLPDPIIARTGTYNPAAVAGPAGVYYAARDGIYLTAGGPPTRITDPIRGIFEPDDSATSSSLRSNGAPMALSWVPPRLYATYTTAASAQRTLVWDSITAQWSLWSLPTGAGKTFVNFPGGASTSASDVAYVVVGNDIYKLSPANTTDEGAAAISWDYTSGMYDMGTSDRKVSRWVDVTGSGTVTLQLIGEGARPNDVADTGGSVVLGTAPAITTTRRRRAVRARRFQHKFSGTGAAMVSRLTHYVDNARQG